MYGSQYIDTMTREILNTVSESKYEVNWKYSHSHGSEVGIN